jgi:predicted Zn-dependent peptidase
LSTQRTAVRRTTLENGVVVVTNRSTNSNVVALGVMVDAGPENDPPGKNGLAHLVEHAMFLGTSERTSAEIARFIDDAGGEINAFTSRDYTCYQALVARDYATYALDLLGGSLLNATFDENALELEKQAIANEIQQSKDDPQTRVHMMLRREAFQSGPLRRSIAGETQDVARITREDVVYFVQENYAPERIAVSAVGDIDHDDFVAQARDAFWRLTGSSAPRTTVDSPTGRGVAAERADVNQSYFSVGFPASKFDEPDRYLWHLLSSLLCGGLSSRLFRTLRENGLVYHVDAEYLAYRRAGLFTVEGAADSSRLEETLDLIDAEFNRMIDAIDGVDEEDFVRAKRQLVSRYWLASESTHTRLSRLMTQQFYFGRPLGDSAIADGLEAVSYDRFCDWLRQSIKPRYRDASYVVLTPADDGRRIVESRGVARTECHRAPVASAT